MTSQNLPGFTLIFFVTISVVSADPVQTVPPTFCHSTIASFSAGAGEDFNFESSLGALHVQRRIIRYLNDLNPLDFKNRRLVVFDIHWGGKRGEFSKDRLSVTFFEQGGERALESERDSESFGDGYIYLNMERKIFSEGFASLDLFRATLELIDSRVQVGQSFELIVNDTELVGRLNETLAGELTGNDKIRTNYPNLRLPKSVDADEDSYDPTSVSLFPTLRHKEGQRLLTLLESEGIQTKLENEFGDSSMGAAIGSHGNWKSQIKIDAHFFIATTAEASEREVPYRYIVRLTKAEAALRSTDSK